MTIGCIRLVAGAVIRFDESLSGLASADARAGRKALRKLIVPGEANLPPNSRARLPATASRRRLGVRVIFGILLTALIYVADGVHINLGWLR